MNRQQLREAVDYLTAHLRALHEGAEDRALTPDEQTRWDEGLALRSTYQADLDTQEARAREAERWARDHPESREPGTPPPPRRPETSVEEVFDLRTLGRGGTVREQRTELRDRALRAVESAPEHMTDAQREHVVKLVERAGRGAEGAHDKAADIALHVLRTGSPAYHEEFEEYMRTGFAGSELRASMSLTDSAGGYLVPFTLDPTILLTSAGSTNPFRQISRVETTTTDTWNGVTSAGVTAEWTAEAAQVADASPTVGNVVITPTRADAHIQASMEIVQDSNLASQLGMLFQDAKDNLEATAFATGSGSTQPFGIVTELGLVTASRVAATTNGAYGAVDVYALDNAMAPRFRPGASWVANKGILNLTRQFATGSGPQHAFWTDFGGGVPGQLIGYPTYESSAMVSSLSTATASNDDILVLGDFRRGYIIVDRVGMSVLYNPLVQGANNRPNGEVAWTAFWRVGARAAVPNAFRMLRV